jgi:hypothetical protein
MARFKYSTPPTTEEARHCGTEGCLWFGKVAHVGPCYNPSVKRGDFHDSPDNRDPRRNPSRRG